MTSLCYESNDNGSNENLSGKMTMLSNISNMMMLCQISKINRFKRKRKVNSSRQVYSTSSMEIGTSILRNIKIKIADVSHRFFDLLPSDIIGYGNNFTAEEKQSESLLDEEGNISPKSFERG